MTDEKSIKLTVMLDSREMATLRKLAASEHAGLSQTVRALIHRAAEANGLAGKKDLRST
jgi:hypothetical protein